MMYRGELPSDCIVCFSLGVAVQEAFAKPAKSSTTSKLPLLCKRAQFEVKLDSRKEKAEFIQQMCP